MLFRSAWLYIGDHAILHVSTMRKPATQKSDSFDHIAFRATGLAQTRALLKDKGIKFDQFGVPDRNLYQVFFKDPDGVEIELVFSGAEATAAMAEDGAKMDASTGRNT